MASLTRAFAGRPESVCEARAWVARIVAGSAAADAVVLMVSELFTNAVLHSQSGLPGGQVLVRVEVDGDDGVRVEVIDQGSVEAKLAAPAGLGKGLAIVAELADECGTDGCSRWFLLRAVGASMAGCGRRAGRHRAR
jgi:two-component sensor histidine kinase